MTRILRWTRNATAGTLCLVLAVSCLHAAPPEVKDDAGFFSPAAAAQANARIREIKQAFKKDLHIETYKDVPVNLRGALAVNKQKTLSDWALSQASKYKLDGVYIHICKDPTYLEVLVDNTSLKKAFPVKDRDQVRDLLLAAFRDKKFDAGLADAVALVREKLVQNLGQPYPGTVVNTVQDHAKFFSPTQIAKANLEIKEFNQRFGKDIVIETFPAPPADKVKLLQNASADEKNKIFQTWLLERIKDSKVDGVYLLISKDPPRLQLDVSEAMGKKGFTAKDRLALIDMLLGHLKAKTYDKVLEDALDFSYDTLDRAASAPLPAPVSGAFKDQANLFSAAAGLKASQDLQKLAKEAGVPLTLETLPRVPPGQLKKVEGMTAEARSKYFADLLKERAIASKADGIYVMITKQPAHIEIDMGKSVKTFTPAQRDELTRVLGDRFRAKQFDEGLTQGVAFLQKAIGKQVVASLPEVKKETVVPPAPKVETKTPDSAPKGETKTPATTPKVEAKTPTIATPKVEAKTPVDAPKKEAAPAKADGFGFNPMWVLYGMGGLVGLWLLIGVMRAMTMSKKQKTPPPQQPMQSSYPPSGPPPGNPPPPSGYPQKTPPGGYPQGGYPQAGGPPQGGYPQGGYPQGGGYPQQPQGGGGGGGFMTNMMGGLFGAAAGSWMYDKFLRPGPSVHVSTTTQTSYPSTRPSPEIPPTTPPASSPGYSGSGGDFGDTPASPGYSGSGGDFGTPPPATDAGWGQLPVSPPSTGGGGDWGAAPETPPQPAGGDWGAPPETPPDPAAGSWGAPEAPPEPAGGDWGAPPEPAGGSWGAPEAPPEPTGGDWGAPPEPAGGSWGAPEAPPEPTGGDWGAPPEPPPDNSGGGDF